MIETTITRRTGAVKVALEMRVQALVEERRVQRGIETTRLLKEMLQVDSSETTVGMDNGEIRTDWVKVADLMFTVDMDDDDKWYLQLVDKCPSCGAIVDYPIYTDISALADRIDRGWPKVCIDCRLAARR